MRAFTCVLILLFLSFDFCWHCDQRIDEESLCDRHWSEGWRFGAGREQTKLTKLLIWLSGCFFDDVDKCKWRMHNSTTGKRKRKETAFFCLPFFFSSPACSCLSKWRQSYSAAIVIFEGALHFDPFSSLSIWSESESVSYHRRLENECLKQVLGGMLVKCT